ncbi:hypothetical protein AMTRI_Chr05g57450 [Amborella trichopoda]
MPTGRVFRCLTNFILNFGSNHDALTTTRFNGWYVVVSAKTQSEREKKLIETHFLGSSAPDLSLSNFIIDT